MKTNKNIILLNFSCIYFIWGSNYIVVKNAMEWFPPFLFIFLRLFLAALVAFSIAYIRKDLFPSKHQIKNAMIIGVFFFILSNASIVWVQQYLGSGLIAVLLCCQPLFIAALHPIVHRKKIPNLLLIGLICGIAGVVFMQKELNQPTSTWYLILLLFASLFGAIGAVLSRSIDLPTSPWVTSGIQMSFASMIGGGIALWNGDDKTFTPSDIPLTAWYIFFYLVVFGSIITYTAYNYLLVRVSPIAVATHSFVNPLVALVLSTWLTDEHYGREFLLSASLLLLAVILMLSSDYLNTDKWTLSKNKRTGMPPKTASCRTKWPLGRWYL
ncbi:MAG: EamA family transporter [Cytophagaceae bacterium]|jgi:drug/metabolite transporter (DMT)-like permease|nr:EamA family transporter [Cytophagaceae bacterium]